MSLASYNPLKQVSLPGAQISNPTGIVVVVGPNSSGKSLFLNDVEKFLLSGKKDFVVCTDIIPTRPTNRDEFIADLIAKNYLREVPAHKEHYRTYVPFIKVKRHNESPNREMLQLGAIKKMYDEFGTKSDSTSKWFSFLGVTLVALLSLDHRRLVCIRTKSFDYRGGTPDDPVQGLSLNSDAQELLATETGNVFGNAVWLDISEAGSLQLRVSGGYERPPHGEMINPLRACEYHSIEDEGDGYKSYVGICLSLLLATRPVSLIDEPELCLHPPQAYHMGRFIGAHARTDHVTFVATHSSHVLRGILETGKKVTVVRLVRRNASFGARLIEEQELVSKLRNPRTRAESILDGIFSKAVVLVESDGDREEYQAAAEAIADYAAREVHFVPVGGTGGFAEPLRFYQSLRIPVAIIADLDAICDVDKMSVLTKLLVTDNPTSLKLLEELRALVQDVKALPPPISETDAKSKLKELADQPWEWRNDGDNILRRHLTELVGLLKRVQRIKEGGVDAYADQTEIQKQLKEIINRYSSVGLFFVPVGELEDWVKHLMPDISKSSKSKTDRAAIAADRIREAAEKKGDIWDFVKNVLNYLTKV